MVIFTQRHKAAVATTATFNTHLNYVKCISLLANSLVITINTRANSTLEANKIAKFERLAAITKTSIDGEKLACDNEHAYAQVAAPWIPVKCYYRLYYLESIFIYLLNGNEAVFGNGGHKAVRKNIREAIETNQITLSATTLAEVIDWQTADSFSAAVGSTIRSNYFSSTDCPLSLRKKLSEYVELDWKQSKNIKDYRKRAARTAKSTELLPKKFTLLDYFYWMRIKANYRDVDFLDFDRDITEDDAYKYLDNYIAATDAYASALETAIAQLKVMRSMT